MATAMVWVWDWGTTHAINPHQLAVIHPALAPVPWSNSSCRWLTVKPPAPLSPTRPTITTAAQQISAAIAAATTSVAAATNALRRPKRPMDNSVAIQTKVPAAHTANRQMPQMQTPPWAMPPLDALPPQLAPSSMAAQCNHLRQFAAIPKNPQHCIVQVPLLQPPPPARVASRKRLMQLPRRRAM